MNICRWETTKSQDSLEPGAGVGRLEGQPVHEVQVMPDVAGLVDKELIPDQSLFYGKTL